MSLSDPSTEAPNPRTADFDRLPLLERARLMNDEDRRVPESVGAVLPQVVAAVGRIADALRRGGRLLYVGAGTSGRLAALDAAEIPPTFGVAPSVVQAVIAGGPRALCEAVEAAEDDPEAGGREVDLRGVGPGDCVVGVTASGRTPFVLGAVARARERGAFTVGVACAPGSPLEARCDLAIVPVTGPEVIAGSTRLKAGTAQKLVLNMLSTLAMVELGKVYGNLMVDLRPTNAKLRARAVRILVRIAGASEEAAERALAEAGWRVPVAAVMLARGVDAAQADSLLARAGGSLRRALECAAP